MGLTVFAFASPAVGQDSTLWRLVAQADVIVVAAPGFPDPEPAPRTYISIPLREATALKGSAGPNPTVQWYAEARPYAPQPEQLMSASGSPSLVFAQRAEGKLYFAGSTPEALVPATPERVAVVRNEIAEQQRLLADWRPDGSVDHYADVARIIETIAALKAPATRSEWRAGPNTQQELIDQLIALGPDAVPAIITLMEDDRPLSRPAISLVNHAADAFEGIRHYGPEVLTDALAAILNQITGEDFGFIYNGASADERRRTVDGWRIYLQKQAAL